MSPTHGGGGGPLEFFGANVDEIDIGAERKRGVSREICVCGHPMAHHDTVYEGLDACQESKMYCPCRFKQAVLAVEDLRAFKFSSEGYGRDHALWKGLKKLRTMGKGATTLVESTCWKCFEKRPIEPVPLTPENRVSRQPQARNVMVCVPCRYVLEGLDPSFLISEEYSVEVTHEPDAGEEIPEEVEASKTVENPAWHDAFSGNMPAANLDDELEVGQQAQSPNTKGVPFEKLNEAPF